MNGRPFVHVDRRRRRREWIRVGGVVSFLVIVVVFLFLPITLPYHIRSQGRIRPAREWTVTREAGGRISATLYDHTLGATESLALAQFDREDAVRFRLRPEVLRSRALSAGDTVGEALSSQAELQLAELEGNLLTQRATLRLVLSGEKASIVEEARKRVSYAEEQVVAQRRIVNRLRTLTQNNVSSVEDLEIAESQLALHETNVEIARAALETAETGAKDEQVSLVRAQIAALESQIAALKRRVREFTVVSPIGGLVVPPVASRDTLMMVADTTSYVVLMAIRWEDRAHVRPGMPLRMSLRTGSAVLSGRVDRVESIARYVGGLQMALARGTVESSVAGAVVPGMQGGVSIESEPVTPLEYVRRQVSALLHPSQ